jgi:uncharacterized protein (DUF885 family)
MNNKKWSRLVIFSLCLLLILTSTCCKRRRAEKEFENIVESFFESYFRSHPSFATGCGIHTYDAELEDISPERIKEEIAFLEETKKKLAAVDKESLSFKSRVDCDILIQQIDSMLFSLKDIKEINWNPLFYTGLVGGSLMELISRDFAPLDERLENASSRMRELPSFLERGKSNLKTAPRVHTEVAIRQNQGNLELVTKTIPELAQNASPEVKQKVESASRVASRAISSFGRYLEETLIKKGDKDFRLGKTLYPVKLRYVLGADISPDELLVLANEEVAKVQEEMFALSLPLYQSYFPESKVGRITPKKKKEVIRSVLTEISKEHVKKEELIPRVKKFAAETEAFIKKKDLITLDPEEPLLIRETPKFMRGVAVAFMESTGPLEKAKVPSFFDVQPIPEEWNPDQVESYLREYNNYALRELIIHEALPGHFVQGYYNKRCPSLVRKVFGNGAMIEGWAVYAERMMVENGYLGGDPRMKLTQLKWYLRTIVNSIIDQGVHYRNMSKEEALRYMMDEAYQERAEAEGKWVRASLSSAQLSTYFYGISEVLKLREDYRKKRGALFDIKKFNERLISYGSPPMKYLRSFLLSEGK